MTLNKEIPLAKTGLFFDHILPDKGDQKFIFSVLLSIITKCEKLGCVAWAVTLFDDGFRLNIGQVEAMSCRVSSGMPSKNTNEAVTQAQVRILLAGDGGNSAIKINKKIESLEEMPYASIGQTHWCYSRSFQAGSGLKSKQQTLALGNQLKKLDGFINQYVDLACHTSTGKLKLKSNFASSHCPAFVAYARETIQYCHLMQGETDDMLSGKLLADKKGWYNGYSWKERLKKLDELKRRIRIGEIPPAAGPCQLCNDPVAAIEYHDEDYSLPYLWVPPAMLALCKHCHLHKLHKRFKHPDLWQTFLAHVRRGGYASNFNHPDHAEILLELALYRRALGRGEILTLKTLGPYAQTPGKEWFASLSLDPETLTSAKARPRP